MGTMDLLRTSAGREPVLVKLETQHVRNNAAVPPAVRERRAVDTKPANDRQKGLVYVLLNQLRVHNPKVETTAREWFEANKAEMTGSVISDVITRLRGHLARPADITTPPTGTRDPRQWTVGRMAGPGGTARGHGWTPRCAVRCIH